MLKISPLAEDTAADLRKWKTFIFSAFCREKMRVGKKERCRVGKRCLSQRGEAVRGRLEEDGETQIGRYI